MDKIDLEYLEEIKTIANLIRKENTNDKIIIYSNSHGQIVLELEVNMVETLYSITNIMEEINVIQSRYLSNFDSSFEMWMTRKNPVIYCTYERIQA